jgi:hypothetical protein
MVSKKLLAVCAALLFSVSLCANENEEDTNEYVLVNKCETKYSKCLEECDSKENENTEMCYDKCDAGYSSCLEVDQTDN